MILQIELRSKELTKDTQVNVIVPDSAFETNEPIKTLWLFHGRAGDHTAWMRNTLIERYSARHNVAVVMPNVDRSWYTNTQYDVNYFNYVTKELPAICRRMFSFMSDKREYNMVGGLSMGGYGSLKVALTYPEQYCACIALSGAVDVTRKGRPDNLAEWRSIFGYDLESPLELEGSEHDLYALSNKIKKEGKPFPRIYMWCGLDDPLLGGNRLLAEHLSSLGVDSYFEESEGNHSWKWWDLHIQNALRWVFTE